ncbi:MAG: DEAD/DEAH box helicase [Bacteroidia bacterium]
MQIDQAQSHKLVYSLYNHQYLGLLLAPYIVQLNDNGEFTYTNKKLNTLTSKEFDYLLDEADVELIKLMDECDQQSIIRKHSGKKFMRPLDFFEKIYNDQLHTLIRPAIEKRMSRCLELCSKKELYIMGDDDDPTWKKIHMNEGKVSVLFHFKRNEEGIRYYPTLLFQGKLLKFQQKGALLLSHQPAWMLIDDQLYQFDPEMEGNKLIPFLNKFFIQVPKSSEDTYIHKFIFSLVERYQVKAEGFEINSNKTEAVSVLRLTRNINGQYALVLLFRYDQQDIMANNRNRVLVKLEKPNGHYRFTKTVRSHLWEKNQHDKLNYLGLHQINGALFGLTEAEHCESCLLEWLSENRQKIEAAGFILEQDDTASHLYIMGNQFDLTINESGDWFDIQAKVVFGEFEIPFIRLRQHILAGIREYELPNGKFAVIPEAWFTKLKSVFSHMEAEDALIKLHKHHYKLVTDLQEQLEQRAETHFRVKVNALSNFETIQEVELPSGFTAQLRHYQQAGLNWLWFLRTNAFGGILADDMGLGKTIQALALLLKNKQEKHPNDKAPALIIAPTSILHNWYAEAKKFAPDLSVMIHAGTGRDRDERWFDAYDLIITSFGTLRIDLNLFRRLSFDYVIIDEGQNIKNPGSQISRAVRLLRSKNRLILSGTPVENSVIDLWSLMAFVNPGLLGNLKQFREHYVNPIEKEKDETAAARLRTIINPFILRRTKKQVATDLPDRIEHVHYCDMTAQQEEVYERLKSGFRNEILDAIQKQGIARSQMLLLRGLTILRQVANHPAMVESEYADSSGKFEEAMRMLKNALHEGHKILVFSQFVKHLRLVRERLHLEQIPHYYLDGQTPREDRKKLVEQFNQNADMKVFLISLKAGGLGLNLTSADYVVLLDPWWNPAVEQQAIDRSHRIGQKRTVISYRFITKNSVEEKILSLQDRKRSISNSLVSAEQSLVKQLNIEEIKSILS